MNKIYKLVWNKVRGCYVVASEFAKANSRTMGKAVLGSVAITSCLAMSSSVYAIDNSGVSYPDNNVVYNIKVDSDGFFLTQDNDPRRFATGMDLFLEWDSKKQGFTDVVRSEISLGNKNKLIANEISAATITVDGLLTVKGGIDATGKKITQVGAGDITSASSTDAVNGGQLYNEKTRAEKAEHDLSDKIEMEQVRARNAERRLSNEIASEKTRAENAEHGLSDAIASEKTRAENAEHGLSDAIASEKTRAENAEHELSDAIASEKNRALEAEYNLTVAISNEQTRALKAEHELSDAVENEKNRALKAENELGHAIAIEQSRAENAEHELSDAITNEKNRAQSEEQDIRNHIEAEETRAKFAETANANAISTETTRAQTAETANANAIAKNTDDITTNAGNISALRSDLETEKGRITKNEADIKALAAKGFFDNPDNIKFGQSLTGDMVVNSDGSHSFYIDVDEKAFVHFIDESRERLGVDLSSKGLIATENNTPEGDFEVKVNERIMSVTHDNDNVNITAEGMTVVRNNDQVSVTADGILVGKKPMGRAAGDSSYVEVTKEGIDMGGNKITNLAKGELNDNSTDAVNGSQLHATNKAVAKNTEGIAENKAAINKLNNDISGFDTRMNHLDKKIDHTGAHAAALAALRPADYDGKFSIAAGMGTYHGSQAAALGVFYKPTERITMNMGATMGGKENMGNFGISFALDRNVPKNVSTKNLLAKVEKLEAEITELRNAPAQNNVQPQAMQANAPKAAPVQPQAVQNVANTNAVAKLNVQGVEIEVYDTNALLNVIQQLKG